MFIPQFYGQDPTVLFGTSQAVVGRPLFKAYIGWPEPNGKNKACCSPVMLASLINSDLTVRVKGLKSLSLFQK